MRRSPPSSCALSPPWVCEAIPEPQPDGPVHRAAKRETGQPKRAVLSLIFSSAPSLRRRGSARGCAGAVIQEEASPWPSPSNPGGSFRPCAPVTRRAAAFLSRATAQTPRQPELPRRELLAGLYSPPQPQVRHPAPQAPAQLRRLFRGKRPLSLSLRFSGKSGETAPRFPAFQHRKKD